MKLTFHGHAFLTVETATGARLVLDPFTSDAGNPTTGTGTDDVRGDAVLITHGHGDHWGATEDLGLPLLAIHELAVYGQTRGLVDASGTGGGMNIGGTVELGGTRVTMLPAVHSGGCPGKGHGPFLGNGGPAAGFLLDDGSTKLYVAGDTALFGDMKHVIGEVFRPDVACLPIGGTFTMGPEHAAIAADWLGAGVLVPVHYDTFEPIRQDAHAWAAGLKNQDVHVMKPDTTVTL